MYVCQCTDPDYAVHCLAVQQVDLHRITGDLPRVTEQTLPENESVLARRGSLAVVVIVGCVLVALPKNKLLGYKEVESRGKLKCCHIQGLSDA